MVEQYGCLIPMPYTDFMNICKGFFFQMEQRLTCDNDTLTSGLGVAIETLTRVTEGGVTK